VIVGLDIGTTMTKAAAFDAAGEVVAVASRPTRVERPAPGRFEQDVEEVVASVATVLAAVGEQLGEPPAALGITGQGDGLWLVDEAARAVRPAISWMDGRAAGVVEQWLADGTFAQLFERTRNAPFPGAGAPLLVALEREEPGALDRAATAARCKDVVMQRLTGVRATDVSDASNLFLDVRTRSRDTAALAVCGLDHRANLLAPIASGAPTGHLTDGARGLPPGTPVVAGPYDLPACALGAGVTQPGDGQLILGTTLACQVVVDRADGDATMSGLTLCTLEPDRWLRAMPAMVGTAALDWLLSLLGLDHGALDPALRESPPGARGALVLPFLSPAGERAPFVAPHARGRLDALDLQTTRADLLRACCESLAYAARHCLEAAGLTGSVSVCGGGAASAAWLGVLADVLQRPLHVARGPEVGARGAAIAAARTLGLAPIPPAPTELVEPDPATADLYAAGYARYLAALARARDEWDARAGDPASSRPLVG
jgi:erythritol kinase